MLCSHDPVTRYEEIRSDSWNICKPKKHSVWMLKPNPFTVQSVLYGAVTDFLLYAKAWDFWGNHWYSYYDKAPCSIFCYQIPVIYWENRSFRPFPLNSGILCQKLRYALKILRQIWIVLVEFLCKWSNFSLPLSNESEFSESQEAQMAYWDEADMLISYLSSS